MLTSLDKASETFEGDFKMKFHLAPPMLGGKDADGKPMKREFTERMLPMLKLLKRLKSLRGTPLDVFGYTDERRMERALIKQYEQDLAEWLPHATAERREALIALARLPLEIRGFGHVKSTNEQKAAKRREELLATLRQPTLGMEAAAE